MLLRILQAMQLIAVQYVIRSLLAESTFVAAAASTRMWMRASGHKGTTAFEPHLMLRLSTQSVVHVYEGTLNLF